MSREDTTKNVGNINCRHFLFIDIFFSYFTIYFFPLMIYTPSASLFRSFAFVASKEFKVASKVLDGVMINYYYYGDQTPEKSMEYIEKSLKYFGKTFQGKIFFQMFVNIIQNLFE